MCRTEWVLSDLNWPSNEPEATATVIQSVTQNVHIFYSNRGTRGNFFTLSRFRHSLCAFSAMYLGNVIASRKRDTTQQIYRKRYSFHSFFLCLSHFFAVVAFWFTFFFFNLSLALKCITNLFRYRSELCWLPAISFIDPFNLNLVYMQSGQRDKKSRAINHIVMEVKRTDSCRQRFRIKSINSVQRNLKLVLVGTPMSVRDHSRPQFSL